MHSIQMLVHLLNAIVFYTLFSQTFLFQASLYSVLISRFKSFFGVGIINFGMLLGLRIYRLVCMILFLREKLTNFYQLKILQSIDNRKDIWDAPAYFPVYTVQRLGIYLHCIYLWYHLSLFFSICCVLLCNFTYLCGLE